MNARLILAVALATCAFASLAQTVYETKGKDGPVFSDVPSAGASSVDLPPANVISMPQAPVTAPAPQAPPAYRSFVILVPEEQGSRHSNTGAFDVKARLAPALRSGDRVAVTLDGTLLKTRFRSPNFRITDADWRAASDGNAAAHSIQLAVVDAKGVPLIESAAVTFYMQRATVSKERRAK